MLSTTAQDQKTMATRIDIVVDKMSNAPEIQTLVFLKLGRNYRNDTLNIPGHFLVRSAFILVQPLNLLPYPHQPDSILTP
jgi:hypothetical protein